MLLIIIIMIIITSKHIGNDISWELECKSSVLSVTKRLQDLAATLGNTMILNHNYL